MDLEVWHWLYAHPDASAEDLGAAVLASARAVWNRTYAPVLGGRDSPLLASGRSLIGRPLGLPAAALAQLMAYQLLRQAGREGDPDAFLARCAGLGRMTPDLWMAAATGGPVAPEPLLEAADRALRELAGQ